MAQLKAGITPQRRLSPKHISSNREADEEKICNLQRPVVSRTKSQLQGVRMIYERDIKLADWYTYRIRSTACETRKKHFEIQ